MNEIGPGAFEMVFIGIFLLAAAGIAIGGISTMFMGGKIFRLAKRRMGDAMEAEERSREQIDCGYCNSQFQRGQRDDCPNCGGPITGS